jgi:Xaa-Pro aminopeptidase
MAESTVDLLVLWDSANIRYFTGFDSLHWECMSIQPAVCVLPLEDDPVIVVPDFFDGVAAGCTYVKDIRRVANPHSTGNIRQLPVDIATLVKELGGARVRIGLESGWLGGMTIPRPLNDIDSFRGELDEATFVQAGDVIWQCRTIKSATEVDAIRRATEAVVSAYNEVGACFEIGMSERDLGNALCNAIARRTEGEGSGSLYLEGSSRLVPMPDTTARFAQVPLAVGDRVIVEPGPTHKGYFGSCGRVFSVGPVSDAVLRKAEIIDAVQEAAIRAVKPGVGVSELYDTIAEALGDEGIEYPSDGMAGHCIGLTAHEPPMIARGEDGVFEEGMVVAIEVWVVDAWNEAMEAARASGDVARTTGDMGIFGSEDLVVVTRDGCDPLPTLPRDRRSLPF